MKAIQQLRDAYVGKTAFCLGTAPHLERLDLTQLKNYLTIGCNQLALEAEKFSFDYICFLNNRRLRPLLGELESRKKHPCYIIPTNFHTSFKEEELCILGKDVAYVETVRTFPGSADFFSHDLVKNVYYPGTVLAIQIQLAIYMGCTRIYIIGVDARYAGEKYLYKDLYLDTQTNRGNDLIFNHLDDWLRKTSSYLADRGIELFNGAGDCSLYDGLPKVRFRAAVGNPHVAVTSKTFSESKMLVQELQKYIPQVKLNKNSEKLKDKDLIEFLSDADCLILGTEKYSRAVIQALPYLRFVSKYGVGLDNIDFNAVDEYRVRLRFRKGTNSDSVAELTLCHILTLLRKLHLSTKGSKECKWAKLTGRQLSEITVGIVGYGHVGSVVCDKLARLGTGTILANDIRERMVPTPIRLTSLDYLLKNSDVVTLHASMEPNNYHMVDEKFVKKMKKGAILINTARGDLIDERAIIDAVTDNYLSGFACDVLEHEPNITPELARLENVIISCHQAGSANQAIENMGWASIEELLMLLGFSTD